jgi:hypothetical protein
MGAASAGDIVIEKASRTFSTTQTIDYDLGTLLPENRGDSGRRIIGVAPLETAISLRQPLPVTSHHWQRDRKGEPRSPDVTGWAELRNTRHYRD